MKKIILGNKDINTKYIFRETCFGICYKDNKILLAVDSNYNEYTLIGGDVENNESHIDTLKREFVEESGIKIKNIKDFVTIDCYWLADNKYPMNSLAHFYLVDIDNIDNKHHEFEYDFINIYDVNLPLPYQNKAIELFKEYIIKNNL